MNANLSVAPEIAQLAAPFVIPSQARVAYPHTVGRVAGELTRLAAAPQRWWDLVRFDPDSPARVPVPDGDGAWLLVVPPGVVAECDCACGTLIAGAATDGGRPLRSGHVLVHGTRAPHTVRGTGHGYSVSLHGGQRQLSRTDRGSSPDGQITSGVYPGRPGRPGPRHLHGRFMAAGHIRSVSDYVP